MIKKNHLTFPPQEVVEVVKEVVAVIRNSFVRRAKLDEVNIFFNNILLLIIFLLIEFYHCDIYLFKN